MAGRFSSSRRLNPDGIRNDRSFFHNTYDRIIAFQSSTANYSSNSSILKPSSSGKRNIDLLSNDEEDNLVDNNTVTLINDDGDDDDSSNADDLFLISSSSSSDGDKDYNDDEEEYDIINIDNDGGGKVHGYTNYRNIFQEGTKSDCECITHDDNNRWTTPTFEASLEYCTNGIPITPVTIPKCDQKEFAVSLMIAHPEYKTPHGYATVNYMIFVMSQLTTSTPCVMFMSLKCTSIRKGVSVSIWGTNDPGVDPMLCPTFRVINAMTNILPHTGINFGNRGFPFGCLNARTTCAHDDKGHCLDWTILEAEFIAFLLTILGFVCGMMGVPVMYFDMGGAGSRRFYSRLKLALSLFIGGKYRRIMEQYVHCLPFGTHASNAVVRRRGPWRTPEQQASSVSRSLWNTSKALSSFMDAHVVPSCEARGIPHPISRDLFQELATDKTMRFVYALTNSPSQMRALITATPKIRDIPLRLYRRARERKQLRRQANSAELAAREQLVADEEVLNEVQLARLEELRRSRENAQLKRQANKERVNESQRVKRQANSAELVELKQLVSDGEDINDVQQAKLEVLQSAKNKKNEADRLYQQQRYQAKRQKRQEETFNQEHPMIKLLLNKKNSSKLMQLVSDGIVKKVLMSYFVTGQKSKLSDKFLKTVDGCKEVSRFVILTCLEHHIPDLSTMKDEISATQPLSTDDSNCAQQIIHQLFPE